MKRSCPFAAIKSRFVTINNTAKRFIEFILKQVQYYLILKRQAYDRRQKKMMVERWGAEH
jgi:hypothetical protein